MTTFSSSPPPLPGAALKALRTEALALEVEDILALCFAFSKDVGRLKVYLDVLRAKHGVKSQAAACLICFDLARRGETRFEAEFNALIPVMVQWADPDQDGPSLADKLIGGNAYLQELWGDLKTRLVHLDPRSDPDIDVVEVDAATMEVALLDDSDLADLGLDVLAVDDSALRLQWENALHRFCDWNPDPVTARQDTPPGFFADHKEDLERMDLFCQDARSLARDVPEAAAMLPMVELFVATHTRARTLFGTRNKARDVHVEAGLALFCELPAPPVHAVAWMTDPTAAPFSWDKVAELILDYLAWMSRQPEATRRGPSAELASGYLRSGRPQPPPQVLQRAGERRRR